MAVQPCLSNGEASIWHVIRLSGHTVTVVLLVLSRLHVTVELEARSARLLHATVGQPSSSGRSHLSMPLDSPLALMKLLHSLSRCIMTKLILQRRPLSVEDPSSSGGVSSRSLSCAKRSVGLPLSAPAGGPASHQPGRTGLGRTGQGLLALRWILWHLLFRILFPALESQASGVALERGNSPRGTGLSLRTAPQWVARRGVP